MKKVILYLSIFIFIISSNLVKASHIAGGDISYTCIGNNQYQITLNLFVDCLGFDPGTSQTITFTSTCGGNVSIQVTNTNPGGTEISQLCPSQINNSTCNGGTLPGMWQFNYTGTVTLNPNCNTWTAGWSTCCRNNAILNLQNASSQNSYLETTMNTLTNPCNNSPAFTAQPIPYVCINQPVNYSYGVVETDGDSLYYTLVSALGGSGMPLGYNGGYSATAPMPGMVLNPQTGLLTFTPTTLGNFVVVVMVQEYDSNGNLLGTVMRDIQFVVQNCTNQVPAPNAGAIASFSGNAVQTGPYAIEMCAGNNFSFNAVYTDVDATDVLTFISNIGAALPGATITQVGASTNPLTLNIVWNAPAGTQGQNLTFTVTVQDGACPIQGIQTFVYNVNILDATTANPDIIICGSQTAQLNAYGGSVFTWSVVSGPAMTPANFSCNPCANPIASPSATTTYAVISDLSGTCDNVDTVTVFVVPDFNYNITQSSTSSCLLEPIQLGVANLSPTGPGYTYSWNPGTYLSATNIDNPIANFNAPGTYSYTLTVTNPFGCVKTDNLTITVVPAVPPVITAHGDTTFCAGGTANLSVTFGSAVPATCGLSTSGPCAVSLPYTIGTGNLTTNAYPTPFTGFWEDGRIQILYRASELLAAGMTGGKISSAAFNIVTKQSTAPYTGFTIKMGCTSLTSMPTSYQAGLTTVYGPITTTTALGWNTFNFPTSYEWDGISNIIVEVCFNNSAWTSNDVVQKTLTTFTSSILQYTDGAVGCNLNFPTTYTERPNIRFGACGGVADPTLFTYSWSPSSGNIANASAQNTTAQPLTTTTFTVTVTNTAGGCASSDSVQVNVINLDSLTVTPAGPFCVNGTTAQLQVDVPMSYGSWSGPGVNATTGVFDPAVAGVGTHQIVFTVNGLCGTGADTIDIVVTPLPDATINSTPGLCNTGAAINLSAATAGGTWSGPGITNATNGTFDPTTVAIGNHIVTYSLTTPCASQDTVIVNVISQLDATITQVGPYCTAFPSVTLSAVNTGGVWSGQGITDATAGTFNPGTAGAGSHVITYTISGSCGNVDTMTINVIPSPIISIQSDTTQGCEPTLVSFTGVNNQPGGSCLWTFGNGVTSTECNPSYLYTTAGNYSVSFTYSNTIGCTSSVNAPNYITIHSQPEAAYSASPQPTSIADPIVYFTDQSTGVIDSWQWTFGPFGTSNLQNPYFVYPDTGVTAVQLIVTNINGCADTITGAIIIDQILTFYAPNAFTPNSNGKNDVFRVYGDGIEIGTFEMQIFNRWGERIFKTNDYYTGWNGLRNNTGDLVPFEVYVWKVNFKDFSGVDRQYIGHVTLVK